MLPFRLAAHHFALCRVALQPGNIEQAMSSTVSPLAPKSIPAMPPVGGVRFATGAAGIRYRDRTDVMLACVRRRHQRCRRIHPLQMSVCTGRMVPGTAVGSTRPCARGQFRQCQRLYRQKRPHGLRLHREARRRRGRLQDRRSVSGVDRCDRASRCRRRRSTASWPNSRPRPRPMPMRKPPARS